MPLQLERRPFERASRASVVRASTTMQTREWPKPSPNLASAFRVWWAANAR